MTKFEEEILAEFDKIFGENGRYLCQYDPDMETHTSNTKDVKFFLLKAIQKAQAERTEEILAEIPDEMHSTFAHMQLEDLKPLKSQLREKFK